MRPKIAIVGAGVSGCFLSYLLREKADVTIFEKSRGVGGRCSYRRHNEFGQFQHGAQFFTIRKSFIQPHIDALLEKDLVALYSGEIGFFDQSNSHYEKAYPQQRYVGAPNMNSFLKEWAEAATLHLGSEVKSIKRERDQWTLGGDVSENEKFDFCVVTAPIPQTRNLLPETFSYPDIKENSCHAFMLTTPIYQVPWNGSFIRNSALSWAAHQNHGSSQNWVLHSAPDLDLEKDKVEQKLLEDFSKIIGQGVEVHHQDRHFWKYASIKEGESSLPFLWNDKERVAACGDWYCGGRVEGALQSAYLLAEKLFVEL